MIVLYFTHAWWVTPVESDFSCFYFLHFFQMPFAYPQLKPSIPHLQIRSRTRIDFASFLGIPHRLTSPPHHHCNQSILGWPSFFSLEFMSVCLLLGAAPPAKDGTSSGVLPSALAHYAYIFGAGILHPCPMPAEGRRWHVIQTSPCFSLPFTHTALHAMSQTGSGGGRLGDPCVCVGEMTWRKDLSVWLAL